MTRLRMSLMGRLAAALACLLIFPAWTLGPPVSFFDEPQDIAEAVAKISASGGLKRILSIHLEPREIRIEAQDPINARHVNMWRLVRVDGRWITWDRIGRPEPVQLGSLHRDLEAGLFDLADLDLSAAKGLIQKALARAALEDPAAVTSMEIRRQLHLRPRPTQGDVRWTLYVRSEREHARIVADAKGAIVRVDLAGTNRARELDILRSLNLVAEAARAFTEDVGGEPVITPKSASKRAQSRSRPIFRRPTSSAASNRRGSSGGTSTDSRARPTQA